MAGKAKEEAIEVEGRVKEALANTQFRIALDVGGECIAHIGGKMRKHWIKIVPGDRVKVELSPYDLNRGRITFRAMNRWNRTVIRRGACKIMSKLHGSQSKESWRFR